MTLLSNARPAAGDRRKQAHLARISEEGNLFWADLGLQVSDPFFLCDEVRILLVIDRAHWSPQSPTMDLDRLPDHWQERLVEFLHPPEDQAEVEEQERALQERLVRARKLYLAGDIGQGRYLEEKWAAQVALTSLHPRPKDVILAAGSYLSDFDHLWSQAHSYPEKARLLRSAVAAAFVKGRSLVALQPTESFFPLMHYCWSGSDGIRTRDLRLDRPACSPLHYAPRCSLTIPQV